MFGSMFGATHPKTVPSPSCIVIHVLDNNINNIKHTWISIFMHKAPCAWLQSDLCCSTGQAEV